MKDYKVGQKIAEIGGHKDVTVVEILEDGIKGKLPNNKVMKFTLSNPAPEKKAETKKESKPKAEKKPAEPRKAVIMTVHFYKDVESMKKRDKEAIRTAEVKYTTNSGEEACKARIIKSKVWRDGRTFEGQSLVDHIEYKELS